MCSEPGNALYIQVVGWLIEQDQIEICHQKLGEVNSTTLTSREGVEFAIKELIAMAAKEPLEDLSNSAIARPLVDGKISENHLADGGSSERIICLAQNSDMNRVGLGYSTRVGL
jgi:hypothetical protein